MKMQKYEKFSEQNGLNRLQMVQFECPRHQNLLVSSFSGVGRIPFSDYWPSGGNKNGLPSMKVDKLENYQNKSGSTGCKWSSLNAPGTGNPLSHSVLKLDDFPFPLLAQWGSKKWLPCSWARIMTKERKFPQHRRALAIPPESIHNTIYKNVKNLNPIEC